MFKETTSEIKKAKSYIIPTLSYMFLNGFLAYLIDNFGVGVLSYPITYIGIPSFFGLVDYFSGGEIVKKFMKEWSEEPALFHLFIIANILIYVNLINIIKKIDILDTLHVRKKL